MTLEHTPTQSNHEVGRPSAPRVDVVWDLDQPLPVHQAVQSKDPALSSPDLNEQSQEVPSKQTEDSPTHSRAKLVASAIHNHHQKIVQAFVSEKLKLPQQEKPQQQQQEKIQQQQQQQQQQKSAPSIPASNIVPEPKPITQAQVQQQQQQQQEQQQQLQHQQQMYLENEKMYHLTHDHITNTKNNNNNDQSNFYTSLTQPNQEKPTHHKSEFSMKLPQDTNAHIQMGMKEVYRNVDGGSSETYEQMLARLSKQIDPKCVGVELCTGGDGTPYFDGKLRDGEKSNVPFARGMCYKWCPLGCACCL
jgi:hypothetical protein